MGNLVNQTKFTELISDYFGTNAKSGDSKSAVSKPLVTFSSSDK